MAKGEAAKTNTAIDAARASQQQFQTNFNNRNQTQSEDAYNRNLIERNNLTEGYGNMANTGGITPEQEARLRGLYTGLNTGGGGGGYSAPAYTYAGNIGEVEGKYREFMNGGGVNRYALPRLQEMSNARGGISDELWNPLQESIGGFAEIGKTGGYSPEALSRIQGNIDSLAGTRNLNPEMMAKFGEGLGGYSEFARTGGVSDQQARDIMARGTSVIPSMYGSAIQQARNASRVQGGYNPGLAASMRNTLRDQAAAGQAAARDTRIGLQNTINEGRLAGMGGLTSNALAGATAMNDADYRGLTGQINADQGLQQALVANKLGGLEGAGGLQSGLIGQVSSNQLGASNALNDLSGLDLQASMFGTKGLEGVVGNKAQEAAQQAAAASAAAAQNYQNNLNMAKFGAGIEQYLIDTSNQNKLAGLGGLGETYTSAPAELAMYNNNLLANQQMGGDQTQANLALRAQYNPNVSGWDKVMQGLQVGTGIAGAFMGGLGGFGGGGTQNTGGFTGGGINLNSPITPSNWNQPNFQGSGATGYNPNIYGNLFGG